MAVTRIKNNQITTASGNVADGTGINASVKLQDYTITSAKIANNLVYGSDLTVSGNLTVNGTTTTIDTVNTLIEDPIITLADGQTAGTPTVDIGVLGLRGSQNSSFLGWNEGNTEFAAILTTTTSSNTTVVVSSYANFHANTITAGGNLSVAGNITGTANFTGNVTAGNLLTTGVMSAGGNVTGGNVLTGGLISATGNATVGNVSTAGLVTATGNVTGGNVLTGGVVSATGNITGGNLLTSGSGGAISGTGNITGGNILTLGVVSAAGNITSGAGSFFIGNGSQLTGVTATSAGFPIVAGTSNLNATTNGNITVNIGGTANVAVFATTGEYVTGEVSATGNVTGANVLTGGVVSASGDVSGNNLYAAGEVSSVGNVVASDSVNTPNVVGASGLVLSTASGNVEILPASGNIVLSNTYINSVRYPVQTQDAASKEYVDNMVSSGLAFHPAVYVATTANLATTTGGTITYNQPNGAGNGIGATITTTGSFNLIDTANVQTANTRILVKNEGNAALNGVYVWSNATVITRSSDADQYGPNSSEELSLNDYFFVQSGNVNLGSAWVVDAPAGVITFGTSNISFAQFSQTQVYSANTSAGLTLVGQTFNAKVDNNTTAFDVGGNIIVKAGANLTTPNIGAATGTSLSVTGAVTAGTDLSAVANVVAGNVTTVGLITATGNVTGGNVNTAGLISATGNAIAGNVTTVGLVSATGNVTGGNVTTAGQVTATGNVIGGNILTAGIISSTGNITSAGNIAAGNMSASGNVYASYFIGNISGNIGAAGANTQIQFNTTGDILGANANFTYNYATNLLTVNGGNILAGNSNVTGTTQAGNITIAGNDITGTNGIVTFNIAGADVDFAVNGDTVANIFFVDAATGTVSFGSATQTANAIAAFNSSNSILLPVGNTSQRPGGTPTTGMIRFNTSLNAVEVYDNSQWIAVGAPVFTVIADEQFNGDGSTVAFTLGSTQTTNSCIVSINGVVQIPTLAYSVSGTDPTCVLTFTEAPATGDLIDVREVTTTATVTGISNGSGNASIEASGTAAQLNMEGNLIPITNNAYSLGNATNSWQSLHVAGNTIYLGNLQLKEASANTFAVYTSDGTTEANIAVGNIDVTSIQSGTSSISIAAPNGNAILNANGVNAVVAASTGAYVTGVVSASGNITGGNISATNHTGTTVSVTGNVTGASLIGTIATASQPTITSVGTLTSLNSGTISSSGNVTGANLLTGGLVSATGTVTGSALYGGGFSLSGNTITSSGATLTIDPNGSGGVDGAVIISGNLSVTGNITYIDSNVITTNEKSITLANNQSTGAAVDGAGIDVGNTTIAYWRYNNATTSWQSNIGITPAANATLNLGGTSNYWATVYATSASVSGNVTGGNILTGGLISATGNITGGNLSVAGNATVTGNSVTIGSGVNTITLQNGTVSVIGNVQGGNLKGSLLSVFGTITGDGTATVGNLATGGTVSATGNITGGNLSVSTGTVTLGNIVNANGNGVGNIGTSSTYFNTVFAKATSAQYADLAEKYTADAEYEPGTVVSFGGTAEVTVSTADSDRAVAGVVSTNPSYIMNAGLEGQVALVALTGRVPTKVTGQVRKGDLMVSNGDGTARAEADPRVGTVIGKALADFDSTTGVIEVVVGRF